MSAPAASAASEPSRVDGVPVLIRLPSGGAEGARVAVWLPYLGGTKETLLPVLERFADAGFIAVGVDPRGHGDRAEMPRDRLMASVISEFRRVMWPILGGTVLDVAQVIDWVVHDYGARPESVVVGGISMGGDNAVAVAGIDPRVGTVAAIASTPDWTRPGMTRVGEPDAPIVQGEPDAAGRWFYEQLNPLTHLDHYQRPIRIRFDVGGVDTHVPRDGATRFHASLADASVSPAVHVVIHDGLDHLDVATSQEVLDHAVAWLIKA
ncbi:prolyl oligopeptidase family serine peptidase [Microbacterium lacticum]|uniref:alpha/beta hydrolase n=1 Tax=Microbacterium lacticum TaxID=33885 RepID=UPI003A851C4C